jgi:hypothetical protein
VKIRIDMNKFWYIIKELQTHKAICKLSTKTISTFQMLCETLHCFQIVITYMGKKTLRQQEPPCPRKIWLRNSLLEHDFCEKLDIKFCLTLIQPLIFLTKWKNKTIFNLFVRKLLCFKDFNWNNGTSSSWWHLYELLNFSLKMDWFIPLWIDYWVY